MEARDIHISSPSAEMIVTLQDMAVLLGLRVDGSPITGTNDRDWTVECERLLISCPVDGSEGWSIEADVDL